MVEKYLKFSDFMSYIFANYQLFTQPQDEQNEEEGGQDEDEEEESNPFRDFFIKFLLNL
jgi:hypothetical protein